MKRFLSYLDWLLFSTIPILAFLVYLVPRKKGVEGSFGVLLFLVMISIGIYLNKRREERDMSHTRITPTYEVYCHGCGDFVDQGLESFTESQRMRSAHIIQEGCDLALVSITVEEKAEEEYIKGKE